MKKLTILLLLCVLCTLSLQAQKQFTLVSPDGNLKTTISIGDRLTYDITCNNRQILAPSPISMTLECLGRKSEIIRNLQKECGRDDTFSFLPCQRIERSL